MLIAEWGLSWWSWVASDKLPIETHAAFLAFLDKLPKEPR
jgi:hypothetical protein